MIAIASAHMYTNEAARQMVSATGLYAVWCVEKPVNAETTTSRAEIACVQMDRLMGEELLAKPSKAICSLIFVVEIMVASPPARPSVTWIGWSAP